MQAEPVSAVYDSIAPYDAEELSEITAKTVADMQLEQAKLTILRLLKNVEKARTAEKKACKAETEARRELAIIKDSYDDVAWHKEVGLHAYSARLATIPLPEKTAWKREANVWELRAKAYLTKRESKAPNTVRNDQNHINSFIKYLKGKPGHVGRHYVEEYIEVKHKDHEPSYRNKAIGTI